MEGRKILVAVAWPYANGPRHIGHVAGFGVPSDIFARYQRLRGNDVLMVSGTDEHGTPILVEADREGVTPREIADRYNRIIAHDLVNLGLSYDLFTRTSTENHYRITQDLFLTLYEKGYVRKEMALGAFSAASGRTLPDRYIEGQCPICGNPDARGDQCDNCGNQLDPIELINPRSKIDGSTPVFKETEHYFLDLPLFAERLTAWLGAHDDWRPNVKAFSENLIADLRPRAITRDLDWGVPIPLPEYASRDDKRIYVWFDAVIGYLSAAVEWANRVNRDNAWREWWQNPEARHVYFMGKDNVVFHSVIWPSMLLGYGSGGELGAGRGDLHLPDDIASSEYLTMEGRKFSSSRHVVIYVGDFLSRYDADALRYLLTAAGPETQDTDFTWAEFVRRNNDELVATWGNLVNRTLTNAVRNFGAVPPRSDLLPPDAAVLSTVEAGFDTVGELLEATRFKASLAEVMRLAQAVNQYLSDQAPWTVIKTDRVRAGTILSVALQAIDNLKVMSSPFLPFSAQRLHRMLGYGDEIAPQPQLVDGRITGDYSSSLGRWRPTELEEGRPLPPDPVPLFVKLDPKIVDEELARMG